MRPSSPSTATPARAPATIVSGSPIASSRSGTTYSRRNAREIDSRRIREQHDRQRRLCDPADGFAPDRRIEPAEGSSLASMPPATNTIAAVITDAESRRETAAYARTRSAIVTRPEAPNL